MSTARDDFFETENAAGGAPVGWRVSMALCNLLIGATILALAGIAAYEYNAFGLY